VPLAVLALASATLWLPTSATAQAVPPAPALISWGAAAAVGLCYFISQSALLAGVGYFTLYRPLVAGTLVGLILGKPAEGAQIGAFINLAYLGFYAPGGALPSDIALAGYLGTALALASPLSPSAALALAVPAGMFGYLTYQLRMSLSVIFVRWAERLVMRGKPRALLWCNVVAPQLLVFVLSWLPITLACRWGPGWLASSLAALPGWILPALSGIGALMPLVGLALALAQLWDVHKGVLFAAGFAVAALLGWPILLLALIAGLLAWRLTPRTIGQAQTRADKAAPADTPITTLPLATRWRVWLNWLFFSHGSYNYERMQGLGVAHALSPALAALYPAGSNRNQAIARHLAYFNTEPNLGAFIIGTSLAMEERVQAGFVEPDSVHAMKTGLMGPLAAVGDTLIQGTLVPAALLLALGLTQSHGLWGPALYVVGISLVIWGVGAGAFWQGYRSGRAVLDRWLASGVWQRVLAGLERFASLMLGVVLARLAPLQLNPDMWPAGLAGPVGQALSLLAVLGLVWLFRRGFKLPWVMTALWLVGALLGVTGGLAHA